MKAKEYYNQICTDISKKDIDTIINSICDSMIVEIINLISIRHVTRDDGRFNVIKEVDNKWKAIVRLYKKDSEKSKQLHGDQIPLLFGRELHEDEFLLYIYNNSTEFKKFIRIQEVDDDGNILEDNKPFCAHKPIPLNEVTNENISDEILSCLYTLGKYTDMRMPQEWIKPLAFRISLLEHWEENGINYDQIDEFEHDPERFVYEVIQPICV
jgi:hypothetical protein